MASKIPLPRPKPSLRRRTTTTLDIGTTFENHALRYLNEGLYMNVRRVGGAGDGGIDLRGWWWLPRSGRGVATAPSAATSATRASSPSPSSSPSASTPISTLTSTTTSDPLSPSPTTMSMDDIRRVKVVAQCKAEKKPLGPRAIREMEGVMAGLAYRLGKGRGRQSSLDSSSELNPPHSVGKGHVESDDRSSDFKIGLDNNSLSYGSAAAAEDAQRNEPTVALLISQSGFSKSTMTQATSSGTPLMLIHLPGGKFEPASAPAPETNEDGHDPKIENRSMGEDRKSGSAGMEGPVKGDGRAPTSPSSSPPPASAAFSLPSHSPSSPHSNSIDAPRGANAACDIHVESIWWNRALSHSVLNVSDSDCETGGRSGSTLELRKTVMQPRPSSDGSGSSPMSVGVALWMDGKPVGRCGPS
ncbi:hypothetical protein I317_02259 [Kwoniella heveanensis CBS 569]|nr:hypothetical protein I317_02259 [Kwoniella heveanensis CBS 569]